MAVIETKYMCADMGEVAAMGVSVSQNGVPSIWVTFRSGASQNIVYQDREERDRDYEMMKKSMGSIRPKLV